MCKRTLSTLAMNRLCECRLQCAFEAIRAWSCGYTGLVPPLQMYESELNLAAMVAKSTGVPKADPGQFELLKMLGQGYFGKAS